VCELEPDCFLATRIRQDQSLTTVRLGEPNMRNSLDLALGIETSRAAPSCARKVCQCPVLTRASNFERLGINAEDTSCCKRANVRPAFFIQCHVPAGNATSPVAEHRCKLLSPGRPTRHVSRISVIGTALGYIGMLVRVSVMHAA